LKFRAHELVDFLQNASKLYRFNLEQTVAIGYSNGDNIAVSMLLPRPEVLAGSILFRAMIPFLPEPIPNLSGKRIFMSAGLPDPILPSR
jgi:phospholipase/carboxylesterase